MTTQSKQTTQHTAGEWTRFVPHDGNVYAEVAPNDFRSVAEAVEERDADIIAAAPGMLEALRWIAGFDGVEDPQNALASIVHAARAAIAKATGAAS